MKLRKHRNNKSFLITSTTRSPARTESHLNSDGSARKVVIETPNRTERVFATGSCKQSVIRAFLFGRDVSHIVMADIREASPPRMNREARLDAAGPPICPCNMEQMNLDSGIVTELEGE